MHGHPRRASRTWTWKNRSRHYFKIPHATVVLLTDVSPFIFEKQNLHPSNGANWQRAMFIEKSFSARFNGSFERMGFNKEIDQLLSFINHRQALRESTLPDIFIVIDQQLYIFTINADDRSVYVLVKHPVRAICFRDEENSPIAWCSRT